MDKLYSVRIDEVNIDLGSVDLIGKNEPLRTVEEVRQFLVAYAQAWNQQAPGPAAEFAVQLESQLHQGASDEGPLPPNARRYLLTRYPYADTAGAERIEHSISILEMSGPIAAQGQAAASSPVMHLKQRQCRVCGCTEADCSQCVEHTGAPCHWVGTNLCSACVPQATPLVEDQWALSFAQAAVIERAIEAHNAAEPRRHDEALQLRIVHRNERDYFVYLTIAKGKDVWDEHLFQLGWAALKLAQQEGGVANG